MGQIFKERANAIAKLVIFGGPALIFVTGAVFTPSDNPII
jgi:hypothetical protein